MFVIGSFQVLKYFKYQLKIYNFGLYLKFIRINMIFMFNDIDLVINKKDEGVIYIKKSFI